MSLDDGVRVEEDARESPTCMHTVRMHVVGAGNRQDSVIAWICSTRAETTLTRPLLIGTLGSLNLLEELPSTAVENPLLTVTIKLPLHTGPITLVLLKELPAHAASDWRLAPPYPVREVVQKRPSLTKRR